MSLKGSIIGDIIGSQYEFRRTKDFDYKTAPLLTERCRFTDDTVLSIATKYAILKNIPFQKAYLNFGNAYIKVGYGSRFRNWLSEKNPLPYGSYGNGSAMRVSYSADHFDNKDDVIQKAVESAMCTHNHPEGIKGSVTTAVCIWMAKHGFSKEDILNYGISQYQKTEYTYSPVYPLAEIEKRYIWDETCQGSVPAVIRCIYEADSYTEFIRNVFRLKCDTDTLCCIGGGIAEELFDNSKDEIMSGKDVWLVEFLDRNLLSILYQKQETLRSVVF